MVSDAYDIRTLEASELTKAMKGVSARTLRERMLIVEPAESPENYVMVFADIRDAKLVAAKLGISDRIRTTTGKTLEPFVITKVQDATPRTLKSTSYNVEIDTTKPHIPAASWTEPMPDKHVRLSHYRLAVPGDEVSVRASDFVEAFSTPVVPEAEVNDVLNHLILKVNGIGKH